MCTDPCIFPTTPNPLVVGGACYPDMHACTFFCLPLQLPSGSGWLSGYPGPHIETMTSIFLNVFLSFDR